MRDEWIPKCDWATRYNELESNYNWLFEQCYNEDIVNKKNLIRKEDYIREINILEDRLHTAKQSHRELSLKLKDEIEYYRNLYNKEREEKFKAQRHEFPEEGLIYFSDSIRNYFIQGLQLIKQKFLYETMPDTIKYETNEYGKFIEEYNPEDKFFGLKERPAEEAKAEWGSLIEKMIKSLKISKKYDCDEMLGIQGDKIDKIRTEGLQLFIKYADWLWV